MIMLWFTLILVPIFLSLFGCSGVIDEASLNSSPLAADTLVVNPNSPSNNTTPIVTGTTTGSSAVKLYTGTNCSGAIIGTGTATTSATATGSFSITSAILAEGYYNFSVLATNTIGGGSTCSQRSVAYVVDTTPPIFTISAPQAMLVNSASAPVTYSVEYISTATVNLQSANVMLNPTGTASCQINVVNGTTHAPTVSLTNCTGDGTIRMSISANTAIDTAGNGARVADSKGILTVDNTGLSSAVYNPGTGTHSIIPAEVVITFSETINGASATTADFTATGTCGVLPVVAVTNVAGTAVTVSLTGASCSVGQSIVLTTNLTGLTDPAGNAGVGLVVATYTVDNTGPTAANFNPVTARLATLPTSLTLTFNEPVNTASVVSGDFVVSGTCTTLPALSVTSVSGALANLSLVGASCGAEQTVILNLNLALVTDATGNAGSGSANVTYTFDNVGPIAASISPVSASVAVVPASVLVNFSENLLAASVVASDLIVSGSCDTWPTVSVSSVSTATATFALVGAVCSLGQTLVVTMNGANITDSTANAGTGTVSATYTFDNIGPVVISTSPVTGTVNTAPSSVTFNFDEAVLATSVATTDVTVTGSCSTLPTISLTGVAGPTAVFSLTGAICANGQNIIIVMQGLSVTDLIGNAGSGSIATTFTIDNTGPTPSSILPSSRSLINMPTSVSVNFDESVLASSVSALDLGVSGSCLILPTATVISVIGGVVTFALSSATCADSQTLILTIFGSSVTDLLGNTGSNNQVVTYTKDITGPSAIAFSPATGTLISIPTSVTITFDEVLLAGSVSAADFTISGTCNILPVHSVVAVTGQQAIISFSGAVCNHNQTTILTVNGAGLSDTAGNAGSGTPSVSYTVDSLGPNVTGFNPNTGAPPAILIVSFSENLNSATVNLTDFILGGTCTSKSLALTNVTNNAAELAVSGAACANGETLTITIDAANVADTVGNAGTGTSLVTFTGL